MAVQKMDGSTFPLVDTDGAGGHRQVVSVAGTGGGPVDTELPAAAVLADGSANPTAPAVAAHGMAWSGSDWGRVRSSPNVASIPASAVLPLSHPAHWSVNNSEFRGLLSGDADGRGTQFIPSYGPVLFNGSTFDRQRGNHEGTLLASAARTATVACADQVNYDAKGVLLFLDVTAASGTGGLQVRIQGRDPVIGSWRNLNAAPAAVVAVGGTIYAFYPGASTGAGDVVQATQMALPRQWRAQVTHGDATGYTYSLGYAVVR